MLTSMNTNLPSVNNKLKHILDEGFRRETQLLVRGAVWRPGRLCAPLYLRTLWLYTNAVIIYVFIIIIKVNVDLYSASL